MNFSESEWVCGEQRESGARLSESEWIQVLLKVFSPSLFPLCTGVFPFSLQDLSVWPNLSKSEWILVNLDESEVGRNCVNLSGYECGWTDLNQCELDWVNLNDIEWNFMNLSESEWNFMKLSKSVWDSRIWVRQSKSEWDWVDLSETEWVCPGLMESE